LRDLAEDLGVEPNRVLKLAKASRKGGQLRFDGVQEDTPAGARHNVRAVGGHSIDVDVGRPTEDMRRRHHMVSSDTGDRPAET
jgi:hypothetical protein